MTEADARPLPPEALAGETGYETLIDDIRAFVDSSRAFPGLARARPRLLAELAAIEEKREQLLAPLQIVLAGGTGTGKSTLLSAIAGAAIAESGETRAFTSETTAYVHREDRLALPAELARLGRIVEHDRPGLRDKILVDTPDFDSSETAHRDTFRAALAGADLVLWVTTTQKYADLSGVETLLEFREGRNFVFALNRDDEGVGDAVRDDLARLLRERGFPKPRIFRISARGLLDGKLGRVGAEAGRDDAALEAFIEQELAGKRIRILKRGNLAALIARVVQSIRERLPAETAADLESWRRGADERYLELRAGLVERLMAGLRLGRPFTRRLRYRFAATYTGLFGAWMQLLYALRAIADLDYPSLFRPRDGDSAPAILRSEDGQEADLGDVQALLRRVETSGRELGLSAELMSLQDDAGRLGRSLRRFYDRVDGAFTGELEDQSRELEGGLSSRTLNLVLNAIPTGWLVFLVVFWVDMHFLHGLSAPSQRPVAGYFNAGLLVCLFLLLGCRRVAESVIDRRVEAVLTRGEELIGEAADRSLRLDLEALLDERVATVQRELAALAELEQRTQRAAAD